MNKRLLIVDDDAGVLDVMKEVFEYENFEVKTLQCTSDILNDVAAYNPDVVLIDYILTGINGGELCHQLKHHDKTAHMPVIMVSAYTNVLNSLGHYGYDSFIAKPFDINTLLAEVNKYCINTVI
ncbi:response regulator [Mucilaginibacter terrigena]|uniref:Response regulator n=1 Tax=Mucilaginibacter terrigena TaxID=2492395 RepID=A0A4Q5LPB1_9SPHI|nr:response regulator [Mucilaginibacter terrigena]RYU91213.1 response regulator [Mucilaginibacter terrigena]